jgi:hypothetical protein
MAVGVETERPIQVPLQFRGNFNSDIIIDLTDD